MVVEKNKMIQGTLFILILFVTLVLELLQNYLYWLIDWLILILIYFIRKKIPEGMPNRPSGQHAEPPPAQYQNQNVTFIIIISLLLFLSFSLLCSPCTLL